MLFLIYNKVYKNTCFYSFNDKLKMQNNSQKWIRRFLKLAQEVSTWSKDPSTKVGAVIVGKNGQIVSQGYNGFPRGISDRAERLNDRPLKYKLVVHAERNALLNALYNGVSVKGCTLFVHGLPVCNECAKSIIQAGISKVYFDTHPKEQWAESTEFALNMFKEAGVEVTYENGLD
jgi:dCMP deaminase